VNCRIILNIMATMEIRAPIPDFEPLPFSFTSCYRTHGARFERGRDRSAATVTSLRAGKRGIGRRFSAGARPALGPLQSSV
jgi:hypothetical protein